MKELIYHGRDSNGEERATVAVLVDEKKKVWARGISICSFSNKPDKKDGRNKARGRAMQALKHEDYVEPVMRREAFEVLNEIPGSVLLVWYLNCGYHAAFMPSLSIDEVIALYKNGIPKFLTVEDLHIETK